jgi:hypothetical protein
MGKKRFDGNTLSFGQFVGMVGRETHRLHPLRRE